LALRELLTFAWSTDPARFNQLMDTGCYPAAAGLRFTRIEHGEEFSLFRMVLSPADERMGGMPALWFSNADMVVEGSNAAGGLTGSKKRWRCIDPAWWCHPQRPLRNKHECCMVTFIEW
jgi:hypothetical protein